MFASRGPARGTPLTLNWLLRVLAAVCASAFGFLVCASASASASEAFGYAYDTAVHVYDGAPHSVQAHASEAGVVASHNASDGVHGTVAEAAGPLSALLVRSVAADSAPLESGNLYINGSKTANNLTPRLTDTEGLSSWNTIDRGIDVGGKGQCISAACLADGGLGAFKSGEPGHFDIRPLDQGGLDAWLAARAAGTEVESPFTQYLQAHAETVWNR